MSTKSITVLYFAQVAEMTEKRQEQWTLTQSTSVKDWLLEVVAHYPALAPIQERLKVAINQYHVNHDTIINPGDEVALFEPVTGG